MPVHQTTGGAPFDPTTLTAVSQAFDSAWSEIADHFVGDHAQTQARDRLARAVAIVADQGPTDVQDLKEAALQVLAMTYRELWPLNWN